MGAELSTSVRKLYNLYFENDLRLEVPLCLETSLAEGLLEAQTLKWRESKACYGHFQMYMVA